MSPHKLDYLFMYTDSEVTKSFSKYHDSVASNIVAIASVSSITVCASSSIIFIVVGVVCMKWKSTDKRTTTDVSMNEQAMNEPSPEHVYEAIANQEGEFMNGNIAYGAMHIHGL